jgi:hypothetical protein
MMAHMVTNAKIVHGAGDFKGVPRQLRFRA